MKEKKEQVMVIGGGLAGSEAAWQLAQRGVPVRLYEMKPQQMSPAHSSPSLAELVCSNSLRSNRLENAVGLLKEEMRRLGSLILQAAEATAVPAGGALAVDRQRFALFVSQGIEEHPLVEVVHEQICALPPEEPLIIVATGPLTSEELSRHIGDLVGEEYLYFYDAIAPIVDTESLDREQIFVGSRYGKGSGDEPSEDYLNIPLTKEEYLQFVRGLVQAEKAPLREFEDPRFFEGCMPLEELAARGEDVLRYGTLKPVGLLDPRSGQMPYAVLQLRAENEACTAYNLVGCQTRLTWLEQRRLFGSLPGLKEARFLRLGQVHRNTFLQSPRLLDPRLSLRSRPGLRFAGQITGVEGYVESAACGLLAGLFAWADWQGQTLALPPPETAHGALLTHLRGEGLSSSQAFQPSNCNWGLFPPLAKRYRKRERKLRLAERALGALSLWQKNLPPQRTTPLPSHTVSNPAERDVVDSNPCARDVVAEEATDKREPQP